MCRESRAGDSGHSPVGLLRSGCRMQGASLADICRAAGWATPNTFARFYSLRVEPVSSRVLGNRQWAGRTGRCHACCAIPPHPGIRVPFSQWSTKVSEFALRQWEGCKLLHGICLSRACLSTSACHKVVTGFSLWRFP